jgi:hypothetical protein
VMVMGKVARAGEGASSAPMMPPINSTIGAPALPIAVAILNKTTFR